MCSCVCVVRLSEKARKNKKEDEEEREGGRGERRYCNVYVAGVPIMCVSSYACDRLGFFLSFCPCGLGVGMGGVSIGVCGGTTAPCALPSSLPFEGLVSQVGRRRRMGGAGAGAVASGRKRRRKKTTYQTNSWREKLWHQNEKPPLQFPSQKTRTNPSYVP